MRTLHVSRTMFAVGISVVAVSALPRNLAAQVPSRFGFGTAATAAEIRLADTDARPDGHGLPHDSGTVAQGQIIFRQQCASCHGPTGIEGPFDVLVGRAPADSFNFGLSPKLLGTRTIGNYWPYATTLYDFINRAMPQNAPRTLTPSQVYSIVAYLLYRNQIIPERMTISDRTLVKIVMPAHGHFVRDDRLGSTRVR